MLHVINFTEDISLTVATYQCRNYFYQRAKAKKEKNAKKENNCKSNQGHLKGNVKQVTAISYSVTSLHT